MKNYQLNDDKKQRTPSRQEYERLRKIKDHEIDKSEIKTYLQKLDSDVLEMMYTKQRSSKKLEGGPIIYDKKSPMG